MKQYKDKIYEIIKKNNGYITNSDLTIHNIPNIYLSRFLKQGILEKLDRGIYILPNMFEDELFVSCLKYKKLCFSRKTALYINGLLNTRLDIIQADFPNSYNTSKIKNIKCYRIMPWKLEIGKVYLKTPFGNLVRTYDMERSICDMFLHSDDYSTEDFRTIIYNYKEKGINYDKLYQYAEKFNILDIIRNVFEVL